MRERFVLARQPAHRDRHIELTGVQYSSPLMGTEHAGCVRVAGLCHTAAQRVRRARTGHAIWSFRRNLPNLPALPATGMCLGTPPRVRGLQCCTPVSSHVPVRVRGLASTKRSTPVAVDVIIIITPPAPLNQAWRWCQQWCVMRSTWWCRKGVLGVHCGRGGLAACKIHNASRQRQAELARACCFDSRGL